MRAGFGKSDLTPPMGVELAGYGYYLQRRCDRVRDPLHARAVLIEDDAGARQLIVSCELLGLSRAVADEVIRFAGTLGVEADRVILVSVHTHTGPCIKYHEGCGEVDDAYVATLPGRICRAVSAACEDLAPVSGLYQELSFVEGDYLYNRTVPKPARDFAPPQFPKAGIHLRESEAEAPDQYARSFCIRREGTGKRPILLLSVGVHCVFLGRVSCVSADLSGQLCKIYDRAGYETVFLNGACGDIDPWQGSETRMEEFADAVFGACHSFTRELPMTLAGGRLPYTLRLTPVTRQDISAAAGQAERAAGGPGQPAARVARAWEREMLSRFDSLRSEEPGSVAWCDLGGVPIFALPFETFTRTARIIRSSLQRTDAMVLGCAEELLGYLPTVDDIDRGSYAALESTFLYRRLPVVAGEAERIASVISGGYYENHHGHTGIQGV